MVNPSSRPEPEPGERSGRRWGRYVIVVLLLVVLVVGAMVLIGGGQQGGGIAGHKRPSHGSNSPGGNVTSGALGSADTESARQVVKEPAGVLETLIARDGNNQEKVRLVRKQLSDRAQQYRAGNFADPTVHGEMKPEMQGLMKLKEGVARIRVEYKAVPAGAQIRMSSADKSLVDMLHIWADMMA